MCKIPVLNKQLQIIIPTHGRPSKQISLKSLPNDIRDEVLVVTSTEADAVAIKENFGHRHTYSLESCGALKSHGSRIHTKRQWLLENIKSENILQLDDDMYYQRRCPIKYRHYPLDTKRWKLTEEAKESGIKLLYNIKKDRGYTRMFDMVRTMMTVKGFYHGCISSRMGNDLEELEVDPRGSRMMHAIAHNRRKLLELGVRFDSVSFREDFHVTLSLLRAGILNFKINSFAVSPDSYQKPGGCATYRTVTESDKAAFQLALLHPGFVTPSKRTYTHSEPRVEVQVGWRKAVELGPSLGKLVTVKRAKVSRPGVYTVLPYESDRALYAKFDGSHWAAPSFSPKEDALCLIESMHFRLKSSRVL